MISDYLSRHQNRQWWQSKAMAPHNLRYYLHLFFTKQCDL